MKKRHLWRSEYTYGARYLDSEWCYRKNSGKLSVDQFAEIVDEEKVSFLRSGAALAGYDEFDRREASSWAAASAEKGEAFEFARFGLIEGSNDIGGVAAGSEYNYEVAGLGEAGDLSGEGLVEAVVVADARDERTIGRQCERW